MTQDLKEKKNEVNEMRLHVFHPIHPTHEVSIYTVSIPITSSKKPSIIWRIFKKLRSGDYKYNTT